MVVIIFRKIPALAELSVQKRKGVLREAKNKIKENGLLETVKGEKLLQSVLSKIRILTLKTENKTGDWLRKLHQRSLKRKNTDKFSDDYWRKLRGRNSLAEPCMFALRASH